MRVGVECVSVSSWYRYYVHVSRLCVCVYVCVCVCVYVCVCVCVSIVVCLHMSQSCVSRGWDWLCTHLTKAGCVFNYISIILTGT